MKLDLKRIRKAKDNRLTAVMQVRNEEEGMLEEVLEDLSRYVDEIAIVDDASTDETVALCRKYPKVKHLMTLPQSHFDREWLLRKQLWELACSTDPDWILAVDADEIYEDKAKAHMRELMDQDQFDWVGFRLFDLWGDRTHYREDEHWQIHRRHTRTLVRYIPGYHYFYPPMDHHVPRLPLSYAALPGFLAELRVKHYGWAVSREKLNEKYARYMERDPDGRWGSLAQYRSILDDNPRLVEWSDEQA
ncbi:glycosyltransferase [Paenibacillus chibensis]|uniref:glycosyltransferase n=1 Tax=Paenibacillus chibensis TaxID=59846 RepID=UPI000FDC06C2|nr:glycosyltransferase [Paenibacillus chibensis]MEC0371483.1 glycosyltransferase family 2 protein [Paenibacillus chibensis]